MGLLVFILGVLKIIPALIHGAFSVSSWCIKTFMPALINGAFSVSSWCVQTLIPALVHGAFSVSSWCVETFIPSLIHGAFSVLDVFRIHTLATGDSVHLCWSVKRPA